MEWLISLLFLFTSFTKTLIRKSHQKQKYTTDKITAIGKVKYVSSRKPYFIIYYDRIYMFILIRNLSKEKQ